MHDFWCSSAQSCSLLCSNEVKRIWEFLVDSQLTALPDGANTPGINPAVRAKAWPERENVPPPSTIAILLDPKPVGNIIFFPYFAAGHYHRLLRFLVELPHRFLRTGIGLFPVERHVQWEAFLDFIESSWALGERGDAGDAGVKNDGVWASGLLGGSLDWVTVEAYAAFDADGGRNGVVFVAVNERFAFCV
nr:hypothetical protein Iba_chr01aCG6150 [Ipomoea batatas]